MHRIARWPRDVPAIGIPTVGPQLRDMIDLGAVSVAARGYVIPQPHPGGRSLSPDACRILGQIVSLVKPRRVLEFGSGFSSLVIAGELSRHDAGWLDSIDDSPAWSARARELAATAGVLARAQFHVLRLGLRRYPGLPCVFYAIPQTFHQARSPYDLVFVDGPGHEIGRDGALPEVFDRLATGGYVVLDDCNADHVRRTVARWRELFGSGFVYAALPDMGNGIGVIEKVGPAAAPSAMSVGHLRDWARAARGLIRVRWPGLNARGPRPAG